MCADDARLWAHSPGAICFPHVNTTQTQTCCKTLNLNPPAVKSFCLASAVASLMVMKFQVGETVKKRKLDIPWSYSSRFI